jgi:hypothetical protein
MRLCRFLDGRANLRNAARKWPVWQPRSGVLAIRVPFVAPRIVCATVHFAKSAPVQETNHPMPRSPLPWWFGVVFVGVQLWRLTVPTAIALLLVGWYWAEWLGGFRWLVFAAAALVVLPLAMAALMYVLQTKNQATFWRTLDNEETVADVRLPAGSRIHFADKAHTKVISIELPRVTEILGIKVAGPLARYDTWEEAGPVWSGPLAEDQILNGIPCRAGYFTFDKFGTVFDVHGTAHKFGLAAAHEFFGLMFPPGTAIRRGNSNALWHFLLPIDKGVDIPELATTAPPGVTLSIADDGRLDHISSGHGQMIVVRGVPLNSMNFRLQSGEVVSELAEPFVVDGTVRQAGTGVQINLQSGRVSPHGEVRPPTAA